MDILKEKLLNTGQTLDRVQDLLKDRFAHYVVIAVDGEDIYDIYDSYTSAIGMIEHLNHKIRSKWDSVN